MQIPLLRGIYATPLGDLRTHLPRNLVPVPTDNGVSKGYLRPADGLVAWGPGGPGNDRGAITWNGQMYRVMGAKLVRVDAAGAMTDLGNVGAGNGLPVTFDYGFDYLGIASGGKLWYYDGTTLTSVSDPDLGNVVDYKHVAGYNVTTDGEFIVVTDLDDKYVVNPLKYGSSESDPDPILAIDERLNELYAFNRNTIEVFQNVGGSNFPFARIEGAQIMKGVVGTHAYCQYVGSFAFVGSGRNETPGVYLAETGDPAKISTAEIDTILQGYSEVQLALVECEARIAKNHQWLYVHLPDRTVVYDAAATAALQMPVWFTLDSGLRTPATYRARHFLWCYDKWTAGSPSGAALAQVVENVSTHYGVTTGWDFGTQMIYNAGDDAIILDMELVCLPGRVAAGLDPTVWTSYSKDGETWSQEKPKSAGKQGERQKRLAWRDQGTIGHYRMQRFRGTSDAHVAVMRIELGLEPLSVRRGQ